MRDIKKKIDEAESLREQADKIEERVRTYLHSCMSSYFCDGVVLWARINVPSVYDPEVLFELRCVSGTNYNISIDALTTKQLEWVVEIRSHFDSWLAGQESYPFPKSPVV